MTHAQILTPEDDLFGRVALFNNLITLEQVVECGRVIAAEEVAGRTRRSLATPTFCQPTPRSARSISAPPGARPALASYRSRTAPMVGSNAPTLT